MHRIVVGIREEQIFLGSPIVCAPVGSLENLDLQKIAVQGPYLGVFASTPCSIFGLHEVDQDKTMFECSKEQAFISIQGKVWRILSSSK
jgi:hypothetical protein